MHCAIYNISVKLQAILPVLYMHFKRNVHLTKQMISKEGAYPDAFKGLCFKNEKMNKADICYLSPFFGGGYSLCDNSFIT